MVVLESCPKHNMVAYLEKTDGNAEFHEIIDFLARSSIHNALTEQEVTDQAKEIQHLKAQIKKLKKKAKPVITHHKAWMKSGRKSAKAKPSVHKDKAFDELADDTLDYMESEDAQDVGRTRNVVSEEKETTGNGVSTEDAVNEGTDDQTEGRSATPTTPTPTPTTFGDDETIAQPLPKIDPKDKGKKKIEEEDESNTESEDFNDEEDSQYHTVEKRAKFLHATISKAQRRFLTRTKIHCNQKINLPTRSSVSGNQMMTYSLETSWETRKTLRPDEQNFLKKIQTLSENKKGTKKRKGGHIKLIARKNPRQKSDVNSDDEHKKCLKIVPLDSKIDIEELRANGNFRAFNCQLEGYLKIMMESSQEENDQSDFWDDQQDWEIITGECNDSLMLDLGLEVERESTAALDLIRFIKQQIDEN
ncbi:hypothetical protein Tco_0935576 [Tanacetum coccineum]